MRRHAATLVPILALVAIYRLPDFVSGVMANPLYIDLGFSKSDIATMSKLYGVWIGIGFGAFAGGFGSRSGSRPHADAADRRRRPGRPPRISRSPISLRMAGGWTC